MTEIAPVQLTGGAGFGLESKVAARLLLSILLEERYFGPELGAPIQIDFQAGESGWRLDDLVVRLEGNGAQESHVAVSVKTAKQITSTGGFDKSFTHAAWSQWADESGPFDREHDLLCLVTANIADSVQEAWHELLNEAIETSNERFLQRVEKGSRTKKALFESLIADSALYPDTSIDDAISLLRRIRVISSDFPKEPSTDEAMAQRLCRQSLRDEKHRNADDLWAVLLTTAQQSRESGGTITLQRLVRILQKKEFALTQYPTFVNDWSCLADLSADIQASIHSEIGGIISLERTDQQREVIEELDSSSHVVLVGPSGVGKSALLKQVFSAATANVVWLSHGQLDFPDLSQQRAALGLEHELPDILRHSTHTANVIVVDAIESLSEQAIRLLGRILSKLDIDQDDTWKLVATCQTQEWEATQIRLASACQLQAKVSEVPHVTTQEVAHVFKTCEIPEFSRDPSTLKLFTNLKVLDWVVQALLLKPSALTPGSTSTKAVVEAIWQLWIGTSEKKYAIGKILTRLAVEEAVSFSKGMRFECLQTSELDLIQELEHRAVLRIDNDVTFFSHDLIADWIRLREVLKGGCDPASLRERSENPVWHAAIRLFGQTLLDGGDGSSDAWSQLHQSVRDGSAAGDIAGDLLLDAIFSHANAYWILNTLGELLLETEPDLFSRLIKRFLLVATVPDPIAAALSNEEDMRLLLQSEMRVPLWHSWAPMLKFLHDNTSYMVAHLPLSVAKTCKIWLKCAPISASGTASFPFRKEASDVSIALAREVQARKLEGAWFKDSDKEFYEAALLGTPENPDQIAELSLELSRRRPASEAIQIRVAEYERQKLLERLEREKKNPRKRPKPPPVSIGSYRGKRLDPWPAGPSDRVDEGFRSVVWKSNGLQGLLSERPEIASEVLLALCIDSPGYEYESDRMLGKHGIARWQLEMPDCYFNGPFLPFLRADWPVAITTILELVNFATDRWCHIYSENNDGADPPALEIPLRGGEAKWYGSPDVYRWHRGGAGFGCPVNCALMALEKWLYDRIDMGGDIGEAIETIFQHSRSAAFAGLFVAIGKKHPELFSGLLLPILGAAEIYQYDQILTTTGDRLGLDMLSWSRYGEVAFNAVQAWNALEHRKLELRSIAQQQLLMKKNVQSFFDDRILVWKEGGQRHEFICAQLDAQNYKEFEGENGEKGWEFSYPDELDRKARASLAENRLTMQILNWPVYCERIVDGEVAIEPGKIEEFAKQLQELASNEQSISDPFIERQRPTAVLAGIHVLLCRHYAWLEDHPSVHAWCRDYVVDAFRNPPERDEFDSPYAITVSDWESIVGKIAVLMMVREPEADIWRELTACSVVGFHYSTTGSVLSSAFAVRDQLGSDFFRLVNVAKIWAAIEYVFHDASKLSQLDRHRLRLVQGFREKSISDELLPLSRLAAAGRRLVVRGRIRRYEPFATEDIDAAIERIKTSYEAGINWMLVAQAVGWLPATADQLDEPDRIRLDEENLDVLRYCLGGAPVGDDDSVDRKLPNELVRSVFERVVSLSMTVDIPTGRELWQPIFHLGVFAHHWVESFLTSWFLIGSQKAKNPEEFLKRWQELIDYALDSPEWQPSGLKDYDRSRVLRDVMGLRSGSSVVGGIGYDAAILALVDRFKRWGGQWLGDADAANEFASFLIKPSARALVPAAVIMLAQNVVNFSDYEWRERGLATNLAMVLQRAWNENKGMVLADQDLRQSFFSLLSMLVQRQNQAAIVLQGEVAAALPDQDPD